MPVPFILPQSQFAFWDTLGAIGEPEGTFLYWAELRALRKYELESAFSALSVEASSLPKSHPITELGLSIKRSDGQLCSQTSYPSLFPLSSDHQLFILIQHNALRGVMTNMSILLRLNGRPFNGWESFYTDDLPTPPNTAPPTLQATQLQRTIPHESWVDVIPYPHLRDNILGRLGTLDDDELCDDLLGGMEQGLNEIQERGIILWGDPWSQDAWELSEGLAKKWAFLFKDCNALVNSTNKWRAARGENALVVEI
jgi:hypothetical protein